MENCSLSASSDTSRIPRRRRPEQSGRAARAGASISPPNAPEVHGTTEVDVDTVVVVVVVVTKNLGATTLGP